jgi:hypothetical protein
MENLFAFVRPLFEPASLFRYPNYMQGMDTGKE